MQILPTDTADTTLNFWGSMGNQSDASTDFMQTMQDAMNSVENGQDVSVNAALQNGSGQKQATST